MRRPPTAALAALAALAAAAAGPPAQAQQVQEIVPSGPRLSAAITQSAVADTNLNLDDPSPGTSYYGDTRLILGLLNETPVQSFALDLDTGLRALWEAEEDFDFTFASPTTANAGYAREWASGAGDGYLRFRQREVDQTDLEFSFDPVDGAVDDIREITTNATERRYDGGFSLELATDSPSSYELNFVGTRFDYTGDAASDRTPRTTLDGDGTWLLQLNPVLSGALALGYSWYRADNDQETEIRQGEIDAGVVYDPNPLLQLRFGLGFANYTREQRDAAGALQTVRDDSGYVLRGGLRYAFEDVTVNGNLRLTNAAPETRLSGDVNAFYPLARGVIRGRLFQRYGGGDTGNEIRVTGAAIGLERELNTVSSLGFDVSVARQENLDTDEPDTDRFDFAATYSRDITEVVSASLGYRFRTREEDPQSAHSNSVFVQIGRVFETSP